MDKDLDKHRVIGIRHALRAFKDDGLIDEKINFPKDASDEVKRLIIETALKFYELGAEVGVYKTLNYIGDEKFQTYKRNGQRYITANVKSIQWQHTFPVQAGLAEEKQVKNIKITIDKLGFE
ncbi:hypothetical protein L2744_00825 [Shewanella profunda]|uniref:hypothetical protein n=1 Tax=Shewanella profunda TaxID=254793 RepID=UPI00200FACA0|nr:hypothetical protein [Shewanella profunda]MCL1088177.1 hypothetical protein [Shewanella profunda]